MACNIYHIILVLSNPDISFIPPTSSPGVLYNPIISMFRTGAIAHERDRVVDHLPLHSRILTHPWCDYAGFCCLAAFSAKPENEGRDADSDWSVAMNESHQLRLARRGACKSGPRRNSTTPIRIICPRHHLAEIKFAWMFKFCRNSTKTPPK